MELENKVALVTGAAGFIGSHLTKRLLSQGCQVFATDNLATGSRSNIPNGCQFIELDLSRPDFVKRLPSQQFDFVCHLAAQSSGPASAQMPHADLQANASSTLLLSRWCIQNAIKRFVYASSMAIYGNQEKLPANEESVCKPISYYGISKLTSENMLRIAQSEGLESTCFRMFSVYGPGQNLANRKQGMLSIFLAYLLEGVPVPVTGTLDRFRDFVYIEDVIDAWISALKMPRTPRLAYNLGSGEPTAVKKLLRLLISALGLPADHEILAQENSASDQFGLYADINAAREDLEWTPQTKFSDGITKMVEWAKTEFSRD